MEEELSEVFDFLMQPHRKKLEIRRKETTIEELRLCLLPGAIRYDKDRVQSTPSSDKVENTIAKIIELEEAVKRLKRERAELIIQVSEAIDMLENDTERVVLTEWYISREPAESVARTIGYSERRMFHFKKNGLLHLQEILNSVQ